MDTPGPTHHLLVNPDLSGYENLVGICSKCEAHLIVNRATELESVYPAVGKSLNCLRCKQPLRIASDSANHPVDQLVYDAAASFFERRYMQCVITLSQAMELALMLSAIAWIIGEVCVPPAAYVEKCTHELRDAVDRLTLEQLRRVLVSLAVRPRPYSQHQVQEAVHGIGRMHQKMPDSFDVGRIPNSELRNLVEALRTSSFVKLRNSVVHQAYRPTQGEAEACRIEVSNLNRGAMKVFGVTPSGGQLIALPRTD